MVRENLQLAGSFLMQSGEKCSTTKQFEERFSVSIATQCRHRRDGDGPPFLLHKGKILYPESGILKWLSSLVVNSTSELPKERISERYKHLPVAREKAQQARRKKTAPAAEKDDATVKGINATCPAAILNE